MRRWQHKRSAAEFWLYGGKVIHHLKWLRSSCCALDARDFSRERLHVPEYYADQLFIEHKVKVRFGREYRHHDYPYVIIFCKVRKSDRDRFLAALGGINRKMLLCGYPSYEEFCRTFIAKMASGAKALREKRCKANEVYSIEETKQACSERVS